MNNKGFTLIELLVVIAIIGILSSIVLASLNTARDKGSDASAKASMSSIRADAELSYDDNNRSYGNVCTDVVALTNAAEAATGNAVDCVSNTGANNGWGAEVQLRSGDFFCVDFTGSATTSPSTFNLQNTSTTTMSCI